MNVFILEKFFSRAMVDFFLLFCDLNHLLCSLEAQVRWGSLSWLRRRNAVWDVRRNDVWDVRRNAVWDVSKHQGGYSASSNIISILPCHVNTACCKPYRRIELGQLNMGYVYSKSKQYTTSSQISGMKSICTWQFLHFKPKDLFIICKWDVN